MQYLVIAHSAYDKDLLTAIHHGDLPSDSEEMTYVDSASFYDASCAAHNQFHGDSQTFNPYRIIVLPLTKAGTAKVGVMEFQVDPPGGAVIKPAKHKTIRKK